MKYVITDSQPKNQIRFDEIENLKCVIAFTNAGEAHILAGVYTNAPCSTVSPYTWAFVRLVFGGKDMYQAMEVDESVQMAIEAGETLLYFETEKEFIEYLYSKEFGR